MVIMKNTIRVERARYNISQEKLAKGVNVSRQTIHCIETEKIVPGTKLALQIAQYFKLKLEDIFNIDN